MKNYILNVDGQRVQVWAQVLSNEIWMHFNGKTIVKDFTTGSKRKRKGQAGNSKSDLLAPMPGKILAVKVSPGDDLKKDDLVVVMEAMKMEYSLKAPADCHVKQVLVSEGEQVTAKQKLVDFEFSEAKD